MGKKINEVGNRYGRLIVVSEVGKGGTQGQTKWLCLCDCGNNTTVFGADLRSGNTKSCGCYRDNKINEVGNKYNRWTVLSEAGRDKHGNVLWLCRCDCGTETIIVGASLRSGHTMSCGCYAIEKATTHGQWGTRIRRIWGKMKERCTNKKHIHYHRYGGRGIKVLFKSFEEFYKWAMSNGYKDDLSIDRINNDGDYFPENCRWATPTQQMQNTSINHNITHPETGETLCASEWSRLLGGNSVLVFNRLLKGWTPERAITTPVMTEYRHNVVNQK